MMKVEWSLVESEFSYGKLYPLFLLYWWLAKPKGYRPNLKCGIRFGAESLSYFEGNAIHWHIKYGRISHLESPGLFKPVSAFDNTYEASIHTKDGDKYTFRCSLSPEKFQELKVNVKSSSQNV